MKSSLLVTISIVLLLVSCGESTKDVDLTTLKLSEADKEEIMTTFMETQDAWNRGNLDDFMKGYWNSEELVFTGAAGPTYGYNATLKRYKMSYPDAETMGMLKFTVKDLRRIDTNTAIMIGRFYLSRSMGDLLGYYTLVWRKIDGRWLIISDHSSGQVVKD